MTHTLTLIMGIHLFSALCAMVLGPLTIWARRGRSQRPTLHKWAGRLWVVLMLVAAFSALGIRNSPLAVWQGFSLVHIFVPVTFISLSVALWAVATHRIALHRRTMQNLYVFGLVVPGLFTLLPQRHLGQLIWGQWLGWL